MGPRKFTIGGAVAGLVLFAAIGAAPALLYGGYAGVALVGWLFGAPVPLSLASRALVAFGMGAGVIAVGALFVAGGAVTGAAIGLLTAGPRSRRAG
jgi:hypothetical protein